MKALFLILLVIFFPQANVLASDRPAIKARLVTRSLLLDVCRTGNNVVAVGERGHILVSTDNGNTWQQSDVPTQATLTAVFFHNAHLGWAVGYDATILHSSDGGIHWQHQYRAPRKESPLLDVWFKNAEQGIAIGAYGLFLATQDSGLTWQEQPINELDDFHLNAVTTTPDGDLFIAGEMGALYHAQPNSQDWTPLNSPYEGSFFGILPLAQNGLLTFGLRGNIYRSNDKGLNWRKITLQKQTSLMGGTVLKDGTVTIGGIGGYLFISKDNGQSFSQWQRPDGKAISSVAETVDSFLVLVGEFGVERVNPKSILGLK